MDVCQCCSRWMDLDKWLLCPSWKDKKAESNSKFSARAMFQSRDKLGVSDVADTILNTTHQNQISCIQIQNGDKANANKISTSAGDGKMVVWDLRSLEKTMTGLKI